MKSKEDQSRMFLFNWHEMDDGTGAFWISYIGPKDFARTFKYTFKLRASEHSKKFLLEGTKPCVPCDIAFEDVYNQCLAFYLDEDSIDIAREACDDNKLWVNLLIQKA